MHLVFDVDGVEEPAVHVVTYVPQWRHAKVYCGGGLFMVADDGGDGVVIVVDGG